MRISMFLEERITDFRSCLRRENVSCSFISGYSDCIRPPLVLPASVLSELRCSLFLITPVLYGYRTVVMRLLFTNFLGKVFSGIGILAFLFTACIPRRYRARAGRGLAHYFGIVCRSAPHGWSSGAAAGEGCCRSSGASSGGACCWSSSVGTPEGACR